MKGERGDLPFTLQNYTSTSLSSESLWRFWSFGTCVHSTNTPLHWFKNVKLHPLPTVYSFLFTTQWALLSLWHSAGFNNYTKVEGPLSRAELRGLFCSKLKKVANEVKVVARRGKPYW